MLQGRDVLNTKYYFDNIVVHGSTMEDCRSNMYACLKQLQKFDQHYKQVLSFKNA
ncbi:hypothetical protein J6590_049653 [Homalodisca vitripennis]|nr:hypothetical protein J6590_049653 [Homalodisca vitripennis]